MKPKFKQDDIIVTHTGAIRKLCPEDLPLLSIDEVKRLATDKECRRYEDYINRNNK